MKSRFLSNVAWSCALVLTTHGALYALASPEQDGAGAALGLASARVSIAGTSNIHAYTASTTAVRVVDVTLANAAPSGWNDVLEPGAIQTFAVSIPAASLSSPKDGLDKAMHKALKVAAFPEITFKLSRVENGAAGMRGLGTLTIAGVARAVSLSLSTARHESTLTVKGEVPLLMTDFGITPPKAMLGMLKTDPKVVVTFEVVVTLPRQQDPV
jgi:hypothetical protein